MTGGLFGLLQPLAHAESHARAAAGVVDELDAGRFKASPDDIERSSKHHFVGAKFAPQPTPSMKISKMIKSSRRRFRNYIGVREIVALE